ncbi:MAG: flagellar biosynthetic protein FliR [Clostridiales bacterium]|jgi:flagellar biosynthetic protein FliR|nr:flagellar biosynthetic protein FliR [Clostridiales bacterium]
MNPFDISALLDFYDEACMLAVLMARLLAFFMLLPAFSGVAVPNYVKVGLALASSILMLPYANEWNMAYDDTAPGFAILVLQEFFTGFVLGFIIYLIFNLIYFIGQLIDYQIGFSMVSVFDPITQIQAPIAGNLFYMAACAILIQTGGLHAFIILIFKSYGIIPPGSAIIVGNGPLVKQIVDLLLSFMVLSVSLSMPIVGAILILDAAMGLLVKTAPQMNIFVVGIPIKLLAGLALMLAISPMAKDIADACFGEAYGSVLQALRQMAPQ